MGSYWPLLFLLTVAIAMALLDWRRRHQAATPCRRRHSEPASTHLATPKPPWVRDEILRLKALMPGNGCRKIAATFNHMYRRRQISVGKSFVANVLRADGHRLATVRREIRRRLPRPMPRNIVWGLDLTYVREADAEQPVFGLIDHGTRACLALVGLPSKCSIVPLRTLLDVIEKFGKPRALRTDNEPVFTSALFRLGLAILGIRHQRTAPFAPWQNGRIERFFGTFKHVWRRTSGLAENLQADLDLFRVWYNHVRPHQSLGGDTPAQLWSQGRQPKSRSPLYFSEWDGLLTGFYFPSWR
jgi:transposase InsO family protein